MLMNPEADKIAKVILEEDIKVVTTGAGSPEKYMADWKAAGVKVIPVIASVALAKRMDAAAQMQSLLKVQRPEDISESLPQWYWFRRLSMQ